MTCYYWYLHPLFPHKKKRDQNKNRINRKKRKTLSELDPSDKISGSAHVKILYPGHDHPLNITTCIYVIHAFVKMQFNFILTL